MTCSVDNIIRATSPREELRYRDGDTADIIDTIIEADRISSDYILEGVECLRGRTEYDTLRNVWAFIHHNIRYRADRAGHEKVKSPGALFATRVGDCKSYSVAIGALLRSLGFRYRYRFAAYAPGDVTHVYVVATDSRGKDVILDAVHTRFDEEVNYYRRKDIRPRGQSAQVSGIGEISFDFSRLLITGFGLALLISLFNNRPA